MRLDLSSIQDGVVRFGSNDQAEYCAVMEVAGSQESLARVDDSKQEELLAAYAQFLNSLTFPFQVIAQVHPVDLTWYVARVEERARSLSPALVAIARDHAAFVQGMTRQRTLLERRIYIVIPWSGPAEASGSNPCPCVGCSDDGGEDTPRRTRRCRPRPCSGYWAIGVKPLAGSWDARACVPRAWTTWALHSCIIWPGHRRLLGRSVCDASLPTTPRWW